MIRSTVVLLLLVVQVKSVCRISPIVSVKPPTNPPRESPLPAIPLSLSPAPTAPTNPSPSPLISTVPTAASASPTILNAPVAPSSSSSEHTAPTASSASPTIIAASMASSPSSSEPTAPTASSASPTILNASMAPSSSSSEPTVATTSSALPTTSTASKPPFQPPPQPTRSPPPQPPLQPPPQHTLRPPIYNGPYVCACRMYSSPGTYVGQFNSAWWEQQKYNLAIRYSNYPNVQMSLESVVFSTSDCATKVSCNVYGRRSIYHAVVLVLEDGTAVNIVYTDLQTVSYTVLTCTPSDGTWRYQGRRVIADACLIAFPYYNP